MLGGVSVAGGTVGMGVSGIVVGEIEVGVTVSVVGVEGGGVLDPLHARMGSTSKSIKRLIFICCYPPRLNPHLQYRSKNHR